MHETTSSFHGPQSDEPAGLHRRACDRGAAAPEPRGFTFAVFVALGVLLAALGIARLVGYWRAEAAVAARSGGLVTGLVFLLAGGFCIFGGSGSS